MVITHSCLAKSRLSPFQAYIALPDYFDAGCFIIILDHISARFQQNDTISTDICVHLPLLFTPTTAIGLEIYAEASKSDFAKVLAIMNGLDAAIFAINVILSDHWSITSAEQR